ncbi:MAG: tyrosine-type recombinase/integrase [Armatimonadota bacterium]|nr:tyrosine-type recombinase/integrase [Armatimonadota bacterium]
MRFDEAAKQFLAYCDLERAFSPRTISAYESDLRQWRQFLSQALDCAEPEVSDVTRSLVRGFIVGQRERGLTNATVARRVNCLRSFWRFLEHAEIAAENPLEGIRLPRTRSKLPTYLTDQEMRRLLDAAGQTHYANLAARDRAVFGTFLFAGLRRTELLKLRTSDVNWEDDVLTVRHGKGGKMRVIPIASPLQELLECWLRERPECEHQSFFVNREGEPLGRHAVQVAFRRAKRIAGIDRDGVTIHTLRHSFASALLRGGASLVEIQQLMGHASLETTSIYLHVTGVELREAVAAHSLLAEART